MRDFLVTGNVNRTWEKYMIFIWLIYQIFEVTVKIVPQN